MAQQTAVQWLVEQLPQIDWDDPFYVGLLQEAKAMEKEQIINFGNDLLAQNDRSYIAFPDLAKQYFNETYNK